MTGPREPNAGDAASATVCALERLFLATGGDWSQLDEAHLTHLVRCVLVESALYAAHGAERFIDTGWSSDATVALDERITAYRHERVPLLARLVCSETAPHATAAPATADVSVSSDHDASPTYGGGPTSEPLDLFPRDHDDSGDAALDACALSTAAATPIFACVAWRVHLVLKPPLVGPESAHCAPHVRRAHIAVALRQFVDAVQRRLDDVSPERPRVVCFDLATLRVRYAGVRDDDALPMLACEMAYAARFA